MNSGIIAFYGKILSRRSRGGLVLVLLVLYLSHGLAGPAAATLLNRKISGNLPAGGDVSDFKVSPDGRYGVFIADARVDGIPELFSAPIGGGPRNPLTPPLSLGMAVLGFAIAPDSQRVVYWTGPNAGQPNGLYSVPITGGEQADLAGILAPTVFLSDIMIAPGSQHVVYLSVLPAIPTPGSVTEKNLWTVAITGGSPIKINPCHGLASRFQMIPDGSGVVYNTGGTPPCGLHAFSFSGTQVLLVPDDNALFAITPDGQRVVYQGWSPKSLFSVPITGGEATQLTDDLAGARHFRDFRISPDSEYVVYRADEILADRMELFSAPTAGGQPARRLTTGIIDTGEVVDYQITPNSQGVVYRADKEVNERIDLYAVTMDGTSSFKLNGANGNVTKFDITPNSLGAVFLADKNLEGKIELFSVYINGTGLRTLNPTLPTGREVSDFQITPNNLGVAYLANQETNDVFNLYLVSIFGGTPLKLNRPLVYGGDVSAFAITPDGTGVAYLADQETDGVAELFTTLDRQFVYLPLILR
jgi:dipeptidyl aminopeptidase/acylaminoacyl peptidase